MDFLHHSSSLSPEMSASYSQSEWSSPQPQSFPHSNNYPGISRSTSKNQERKVSYTVLFTYLEKGTCAECTRPSAPHSTAANVTPTGVPLVSIPSGLVLSLNQPVKILALGPSRQGAPRLRSTEVDAPFPNFSKSQGNQQRHS